MRQQSTNMATCTRSSKLSQNKRKPDKHVKGVGHLHSDTRIKSHKSIKHLESPKRRYRRRCIGVNNGDSPGENEASQDIIWDPGSPTSVCNGKRVNKTPHIRVEISDIVSRLAPQSGRPVDQESPLLQWIGDSAVSCTPEVRVPRVRRASTRQKDVDDLMKLAKQFDINMFQQSKETDRQDNSGNHMDELNQLNKRSSVRLHSLGDGKHKSEVRTLELTSTAEFEEELQALFDGPTQRPSGRLSPQSSVCSQESRSDPVVLNVDPQEPLGGPATKNDFDDDWEDDDLLNDSFVVEMTQKSDRPCVALKGDPSREWPAAQRRDFAATGETTLSNASTVCHQPQHNSSNNSSSNTKISSNSKPTNRHTVILELNPPLPAKKTHANPLVRPGPTPARVLSEEQRRVPSFSARLQAKDLAASSGHSGIDGTKSSPVSGGKVKGPLDMDWHWAEGEDDDDDDLLYQVCDNVEKISASQEQLLQDRSDGGGQRNRTDDVTEILSDHRPAAQTLHEKLGMESAGQTRATRQPIRTFTRSNSVPGSGAAAGSRHGLSAVQDKGQNRFTKFRKVSDTSQAASEPRTSSGTNPTKSHQSSFKRHLSDPTALFNKVFVPGGRPVQCTAMEIERKKQEAIARRRLRMQTSQKPGAPTEATIGGSLGSQ